MKASKLFTASFLVMLSFASVKAQPVWNSGPTVNPFPIHLELNFNLDRPSIVYYFVIPGTYLGSGQTPAIVKSYSIQPLPYGPIIDNNAITYNGGSVGNNFVYSINGELSPILSNQTYSIYVVAEDIATGVLSNFFRIYVTTPPCPAIGVATNLIQPIICINKFPQPRATFFAVATDPNPDNSGLYIGTEWTLDWGDGNVNVPFISTVENEIPPAAWLQHTYTTVTDCNYLVTSGIKNKCGSTRGVSYIAVVHGRDQSSDGDGILSIVNNAGGPSPIQVCEGTQTIITIRDNSTWNCQNPTVYGTLTATPNLDPRNIEWLYGRDPLGVITNTITGNVAIATLGNAPQASGRLSPIAAPGTLSQAITIPATCVAGQFFRVYLKNWNKCNWTDPEYIYTSIDINVIAAPGLPVAPDKTICFGGDPTLTAAQGVPAGNLLTWYANANKTGVLGTGPTYNPGVTAIGTYTYYVADGQTSGNLCIGPVKTVVLNIIADPIAPVIAKNPADGTVCAGATLSIIVTTPGSGGTGVNTDQYQYSTDNGTTWSAWSTTVPSFAAVTSASNIIQTRRNSTGSGCVSNINSVSWAVVADPVAPVIAKNPIDGTVCAGATLSISVTTAGSGGTGVNTDEYSYSTDNGGTYSAWSTTIPSFVAVTSASNIIRSRRNSTGTGCNSNVNTVSWIVVADPVAPVIAKNPADGTVCEGATLSVTVTTAGSGGTGVNTDEYSYSTDNGGTYSAWSTTVPSFAAVTSATNIIRSRRNSTGTGCNSNVNSVSWIVVADPVAPVIAKNPADGTVCAGATLSITVTTPGSGGTGVNTDEYSYSTDNGGTYSAWSTTVPSFAAVTSATNIIRSRRNSTGTGCNSNINSVSWIVVADPVAPVIAKSPADGTVCEGATLSITVTTAGSGGTGVSTDEYRYSTNNGGSYSAWSSTIPSFAAVTAATNIVQSRRTATGTGCNTSPVNSVSWIVVADPVAPVIAKNPADGTVCEGATLSITVTTAGSGGTGVNTDEYSYSTDNGGTYSAWSTTIPSFAAVTSATNIIRSRRNSTGTGCNSNINSVSWIVVADPVAPVIAKNPADATVCAGATLSITVTTAGSGGTGVNTDEYSYSTDNGVSYSAWSTTVPSFAAVTSATNIIRSRRNSAGTGCNSNINSVSWIVVADPVAPVIAKNPANGTVCEGATLSITVTTAGSGGTGVNTDEYSYSTDNGGTYSAWSTTIPSFAAVTSATNIIRSRRNSTGTGCNSNINSVSWIVVADPVAPVIAKNPADGTVCEGATLSITVTTAGSGGTGVNTDEYSYSTDNGGTYSAWSTTIPSFAAVTSATNIIRSRRNSTGTGCNSNINSVSWIVVADPVAPVIAKNPADGTVCAGSVLSVTITTAGSGGTGVTADEYRYSTDNGGTYSAWSTTIPGFAAVTSASNIVQSRRNSAGTGCNSNINSVNWVVVPQPAGPTLNVKTPNQAAVCAGTLVNATFNAGSGGVGCSDSFQYRFDGAGGWSVYTGGTNLNTTGHTLVEIQGQRAGCTATAGCTGTAMVTLASWVVNPLPAPVVSGSNNVCSGATLVNYSTPLVAGHTYVWAISGGAITAGAGTNSITVTWGAAGAGWVRVAETITATTCALTTANYVVTINPGAPLTAPTLVSAPTDICSDGTLNIDVTDVASAAQYIWDYSWVAGINNASTVSSQNAIDLTGLAPGTYTVTVAGSNGCGNGPFMAPVFSFDINDVPDLSLLTNTVCSDGASGINLSITNAGVYCSGLLYNITAINPNGLTASAGAPATGLGLAANVIADDAWTNKTGANVNVVYTVVPVSAQGCTGLPESVTLTVRPEPVLAALDATKCSDEALGFNLNTAAGSTPAATYNITAINPNGLTASAGAPAVANGLAANVIADDAWTNTTAAAVNVVYTIVPVGVNTCLGDAYTMTITVNPEPTLAALSNTVCSDSPSAITLSVAVGSVAASTYNITNIANGGLTASAGAPATGLGLAANVIADDAWTNKTAANVNVVYTVVPVSAAGCLGNPLTVTLTVRPEPVLAALDATKCSDEALGFNLNTAAGSTPAATYNITAINPNGLTASAGAPAVANGLAANVIADDAWTNTTAAAVNVVYTIVPVGVNTCLGDAYTMTITVNPEPTLAALSNTVCSDSPSAITLSVAVGSVAASTYNITNIANGGLTASAGAPATGTGFAANVIADDAWTNKTAANVNVVYTVVPVSASGCLGNPLTVTLTVRPEPVLAALDATKCSDEALGFNLNTAAGSTPAATYNITAINPNGLTASAGAPAVANGLAANVIADDAWTNTTAAAVNVVYTIVPVGVNTCLGDAYTMTITVNPEPTLAALSNTVCSDSPSAITLSVAVGSVAASTYNITNIANGGLTASAGAPATGTGFAANVIADDAWTNKTAANVNVVYTVVPVSAAGCLGNPLTVTLTVRPEPVLAALDATKCSDEALGFNLNTAAGSTPAATYNITAINPNGLTASAGAPAVANGLAANVIADDAWTNTTAAAVNVVYTIVPVGVNTCLGDAYTMTITVNPEPTLANLDATKCSDEALGFNLSVAAGSVAASTYNITAINPNGLTASAGAPAVANGLAANVIADDAWTNTTAAAVNVVYTVVPVSAAGCQGNPRTITITVNPEPTLAALSNTVCSDSPSAITLSVAVGSVAASTYNITNIANGGLTASAGAPATGTGFAANVIADDAWTNKTAADVNVVYTVVPVSAAGCLGNPLTVTLTVRPEPVLAALDATKCSDEALGFNLNTAAGSTPAATYNITAINPNGLTASAGAPAVANGLAANVIADDAWTNTTAAAVNVVYTIVPVGVNTCLGDAYTMTITVNPEPTLAALSNTVCSDSPSAITLSVAVGSVAASTYNITNIANGGLTASAGAPATGTGFAANVIADDAWTNKTAADVNVVYTVVPVSAAGCLGNPLTVTLTVRPEPVLAALDATKCSDEALGFNLNTAAGSTPAATYNITAINPNGLTASAGAPAVANGLAANVIADDAWTNTTATPKNVVYTIVPVGVNTCLGDAYTMTITVNPEPTLAALSNTVCSDSPSAITLSVAAGSVAASTYNITAINPNGLTASAGAPAVANGLAANVIADDAWTNTTAAAVNVVYTVVPVSAAGCQGNPRTITLTVNPEPVGSNATGSVCSGNALNYSLQGNINGNNAIPSVFTYTVISSDPVGVPAEVNRIVASNSPITHTYTNNTGVLVTVTYSITPVSNPGGCAGTPFTYIVTVGSEPVLDPGLNTSACSNTPIGLVLGVAAGSVTPTYYNILSKVVGGGLTEAGNAVLPNGTAPDNFLSSDRYVNTTGVDKIVTYHIQPILAPDCFGAFVDVSVTIHPQPVIFPAQTKTVCSRVVIGKEILLSPPNVPAGTLFNWPVPSISDLSVQGTAGVNVVADPAGTLHINDQIHNYSAAPIQATYSVTPVSSNGCAGTAVPVVITINPEPIPQPISGRDKICVTDKNIVYNVSAVGGSTFHWTVDAAVGTKVFDMNANAILIDAAAAAGSGNILVTETNSFGCAGDASAMSVQVYAQPVAEVIAGNTVVCANSSNIYSVTARAGSIYNWTVPGGAAIVGDPSAASIIVIFANVGGTISVRETNAAGCITNHTPKAVTVNPLPTATISGGTTICNGASRNLTVVLTGTSPYTFTYALDGVSQPPVATLVSPYTLNVNQPGTYTIVNVSDANCTNNGTGTTTVSFFPQPTGTISGTTEMCRGGSATLTISFTGVAPYNFTYTDGTTPVNVVGHLTNVYTATVSPLVNTTYTLTSLTDGNTCAGVVSGSAVISVNPPPVLTLTGTNLICYNVNTGAVSMAIAGGTAPFGFSWTGPGGFTANTQDISSLASGYYAVVVTDSKGCTGTANITLSQPPVLTGSAAGTNITCFGANDGTITISGAGGGAGTYEFSIDGGGTWQVTSNFIALSPGTYNVMMRDAANPTCILPLNGALQLTQPAILNAVVTKTDINCFGAANGSIVISAPTGGYGTYGYSINGGSTWQGSGNFTNLTAGSHDVRIRDAANIGCFVILDGAVIISEPLVLSATLSSTNVTCFGSTDGTITISAPLGGHGTYEYSINGGGSWQAAGSYTGLATGNYNVQIRDAGFTSCFRVLNATLPITQPAVLQANVASTNVTCNSTNDGIINITAPLGGSGTYEYSITGGAGWQVAGLFNALAPGTYDVRIRDAAHPLCFIILNGGLQITEPGALNATVIGNDITCFGANDGQIQITNSAGGYGTYDYSDNGGATWQPTGLFTLLTPGNYNVQMRDRAHPACVKILANPLAILQPAVLNATVNHTNVTCNGASDGTITISGATGGYGSYGYSINGGTSWQGSANFTNLGPGTYNIRIRDAVNTGCIIPLNPAVVITQPAALTATIVKTNVNCYGAADGTISINGAAGGYGTYEYTINGGAVWQGTGSFTGLIPGFYNVKIRDAANQGCIVTLSGSLNITEPPVLNANVAKTNITCFGANNGTITITSPTGGYGTYEYSINGGVGWQVAGSFAGLTPATYNVRIRDAAHPACVVILSGALVITEPAILAATISSTNINCNGASDGTITISGATGGSGTYEYTVTGGTVWTGLNNFTNRSPGIYDVRIRDAANIACVVILNGGLTLTQPPALTATVARTNITCFGSSDGTITISAAAGGYGTYEYSINGGGSWQGLGIYPALGPGNYNVQIRDAAHTSCVVVLNNSVQITQPAALTAVVTPTNVSCNGANNGIINITAPAGGSGTYDYSTDGGATWHPSGLFNGLIPATYNVQIRDAANPTCQNVLNSSVIITQPAVLNAVVASANISCNGANDGTISVTSPTGGYGTFDYSDDGGATWQALGNFTNLIPGTYNVQIRDRAHTTCVAVLNATLILTQPAALTATLASSNVTCFGANNGTITITNPLGGYGTYSYSVNGGASWQPTGTFTNLAPSTYVVRIRDAANIACEATLHAGLIITQPPVLSATVTSSNVSCNGAGNGTITIASPLGGYGTYEYSVTGGTTWQPSGNFAGLIPGFYNVQIRDAANASCVIILNGSLQVTQPAALSAFVSKTNITCNGVLDGTITIVGATGGYGTYEYSVNGGTNWQVSGSFTGLPPATYNVQMRDAAHTTCVKILDATVVITQPPVLAATVTPTMITCSGANDGRITISAPTGGYGSYQFSIDGGTSWQGSGTFTNLSQATYNVRMRDAGNTSCALILAPALIITEPVALSATLAHTNVTCFGGNDGTITISAPVGGYGTYEYSINGGGSWQASGNFTLLTPGLYNVLIRDAAHPGCVITLNGTYTISQPAILAATVTKTDVSCRGANDGIINITSPTGGSGTYQYSVDGGISWVGAGNFSNLVPATYDVRIRDAANIACTATLYPNLIITEPVQLALTSTGDIVLDCFGDLDGSGTFYASGGTLPYNFHVILPNTTGATLAAPGFNSQSFYNAGAGSIIIAVTDFHGCFAQATINVTQPAPLTPGTIAANQVVCAGTNPAQINETVPASGGPVAYNYQWQYGNTAVGPFINIAGASGTVYTPPAGANTTLYYRRMITSGTCMPVYSNVIQVLVNPRPVAVLTGGETICPSQNSILKVNMMVGTGPFELDVANFGTITGYVSGSDIIVSPGITTVYTLTRVRDANGCQVIAPSANLIGSATVTVRDLPVITSSPVSKTICEFGMVAFSTVATGTDLTYQWYVNTGSGFNAVADGGVYFGATNSTLSLFGATRLMTGYIYHAVVTGCSASVTSADATLTVNTIPEISKQPRDSTVCLNAGATFRVNATGTALAYQWQVNKGTGFNNVVDDANFSGSNLATLTMVNAQAVFNNYIFRVIVSGSCGIPVYSNFAVLRVNVPPTVTLNPVNKSICDGSGPVIFSANGSGNIDSMRWEVFNGTAWSDVHDNAVYSGSTSQQLTLDQVPLALNGYLYRLALKAKCTTINSAVGILTVNPNPVVNFSAIDPIHACGSVPIVINGNPTGGSGIWSSHLWTGDVGPLNNYFIQSPTFNSQIAGTYLLNYKVKDNKGCSANGNVTVLVDAPDATFTQDQSNGCTPLTVNFTKDMTGIASFSWDYGDGSPVNTTTANPVHIFTNANPASIEYYNVKLTVTSAGGCVDTYTSSVTVYPSINATFTSTPATVCSGNQIVFTTLPGASKYFWDFGDGVSGYFTNTTNHLYTNFTTAAVVHTVTLTTTSFYNCTDVKTVNITVMPVPIPQFAAVPPTQEYDAAGNPVTFTNTTNPGTWNWLWDFGDGTTSTAQSPSHTYASLGTFDVVLTVSNANCSDFIKHQVIVTPKKPIASFDLVPSGCSPLTVTPNNTSQFTNTPGTTYMWDFGDGGASTSKNPTYTYFTAGTYVVKLTVSGPGGISTFIQTQLVNAYPSPLANFQVAPTTVFVNDEKVRMFNLSLGADSYLWEFGDGDTSKVKEPFHKYLEEGIYDITLWAYLHNVVNGVTITCSNKFVLSPGVTVEPSGVLKFSTVFTPNTSSEVDIDHLPTGGTEIDQFFFPGIREKVIKYKLQIFNRLGVLIFQSDDINKPWNGYYQHKLCPQGVYVWYVEGKYANGMPFKKVGDVTLLH